MVPHRQMRPARLLQNLLLDREVGVGQKDGHLLLVFAVEQPQPPTAGATVLAQAPVEFGASGAAMLRQFFRCRIVARAAMLADAQMEMPVAEIHGQIAVRQADPPGRVGGAHFPHCALYGGAEVNLVPVVLEHVGDERLQKFGISSQGEDF